MKRVLFIAMIVLAAFGATVQEITAAYLIQRQPIQ
jgi:archaellin